METDNKSDIRRIIRERLHMLAPEEKKERSEFLFAEVCTCIEGKGANVIALYSSLPDEPRTSILLEKLSTRHTLLLPRVCGGNMEFYRYDGELQRGAFGILEPTGEEPFPVEEIDVMVVPGVAFTADGYRLGRGKGYYDKYLSRDGFRAFRIGVCFSCQLTDTLPVEPHDIKMDIVVVG